MLTLQSSFSYFTYIFTALRESC